MTSMRLSATPGPIASQAWFAQAVARAARGVPASSWSWRSAITATTGTGKGGDPLTVEEGWQAAREFGRDAGVRPRQRQFGLRV